MTPNRPRYPLQNEAIHKLVFDELVGVYVSGGVLEKTAVDWVAKVYSSLHSDCEKVGYMFCDMYNYALGEEPRGQVRFIDKTAAKVRAQRGLQNLCDFTRMRFPPWDLGGRNQ